MTDANGAVVSSSSGGTVQLSSNGQITNLNLGTFNRPPTLVQFQGQGAQGRSDLPTLRLNITNPNGQSVNNSTIDVPGVWKPDLGDAGAYTYDWSPAAQWLPASQTANPSALEVTASLLDAAGVQGATLGSLKLKLSYPGRAQSAQASLQDTGLAVPDYSYGSRGWRGLDLRPDPDLRASLVRVGKRQDLTPRPVTPRPAPAAIRVSAWCASPRPFTLCHPITHIFSLDCSGSPNVT